MFYPHKKIFSIAVRLTRKWRRDKIIFLKIPQATIRERSEFGMLKEIEREKWLIKKIAEWGGWKYAFDIFCALWKNIMEILGPYFFYSYNLATIPKSVVDLREKEKYQYDVPESTIFMTIAKEYRITPRELLEYTMDELNYLVDALHYKNLNDEQKAELQRIKICSHIKENKDILEKDFSLLDNF